MSAVAVFFLGLVGMFLCSFQNSVATYFIRLINSLSNIKKNNYSDLICHECPRQPLSVCIFYKSCKIRGEAKPWQVWTDWFNRQIFFFQWFVQWNCVPGFRLCVLFLSKKHFPFFYSSIKVKAMTFPMLMLGALPSCQGNAGTAERFSQDQRHLGPLGWRISAIMADLGCLLRPFRIAKM